jgi:hypothetical protein
LVVAVKLEEAYRKSHIVVVLYSGLAAIPASFEHDGAAYRNERDPEQNPAGFSMGCVAGPGCELAR